MAPQEIVVVNLNGVNQCVCVCVSAVDIVSASCAPATFPVPISRADAHRSHADTYVICLRHVSAHLAPEEGKRKGTQMWLCGRK